MNLSNTTTQALIQELSDRLQFSTVLDIPSLRAEATALQVLIVESLGEAML